MKSVILLTGLTLLSIALAYYSYSQGNTITFGIHTFAAGFCAMGAFAIYMNEKQ